MWDGQRGLDKLRHWCCQGTAGEDREININRIAIRVSENGHDVAPDKVRSLWPELGFVG